MTREDVMDLPFFTEFMPLFGGLSPDSLWRALYRPVAEKNRQQAKAMGLLLTGGEVVPYGG